MDHIHQSKPQILKSNGKTKQGKGFSPDELKAAGVSKQQARNAGFAVDMRRKSSHDQNVDAIKAQLKKQ
jgi:large subunit ribosomal protein L13e